MGGTPSCFNNGDRGIANKAGAKAADAAWKRATETEPEPVPFPGAEFQFLVESTAYSGGGCCSGIYIARSYLAFAYAQIWNEPTIVRLGLQTDNEDSCLHFADQQFVYAKSIRSRLNTNR